ncbi:cyclin-like protein [Gloeopeniophorella convolvens]|nr:cyclin-like protein [Gloeopeniophorella convolvens]
MQPSSSHSQWLFPISALSCTPTSQDRSLHEEMYDRSRGIEFLYRLGTSIGLHSPGLFTAATWFHRFFMRYSMLDYHRQTVAAACIFLATKTEECGRKLKDVARVCQSKAKGVDVRDIPEGGPEIEEVSNQILATEEVLLEALCFDFIVDSPHADLVDLFEAHRVDERIEDYAWSIAHDSYRTPLCVLYPPKIIATACYVLSQRILDGPHSLSLDARVSPSAPSSSLPTPPSYKPSSPDASRFAAEFFGLNEADMLAVADALAILLNFYEYQTALGLANYLDYMTDVSPPAVASYQMRLYPSSADPMASAAAITQSQPPVAQNGTPVSVHGDNRTPAQASLSEEVVEKSTET